MTSEEIEIMQKLNADYEKAKLPWRIYRLTLSGKAPHRKASIKAHPV